MLIRPSGKRKPCSLPKQNMFHCVAGDTALSIDSIPLTSKPGKFLPFGAKIAY
jgi:hypothetical protein